ncbi:hypothetical protein CDL12_09359 [Handroanthus impetiginosus]|uniref:Uncharacterized protein n=1 Tax=Handroanthus impetiginosus TaxID=429701 RepID=A0A2G9HKC9_9LAMI|nr:hypothetical protein CDL12_09359 [Handroanthus impetiginosus]
MATKECWRLRERRSLLYNCLRTLNLGKKFSNISNIPPYYCQGLVHFQAFHH